MSLTSSEKNWGMLTHLSALVLFIGFPFGNILVPLFIWLIKRDESPFINQQGKASINFQISITIYYLVTGFLCFLFIGFFLLPFLIIGHIALTIVAAVKASDGRNFSYPFSMAFLK